MSFPLYLDECVDVELAALLRKGGFDVLTTQEAGHANQGRTDEAQLLFASEQGRAIFTHNVRHFEPLARQWSSRGRVHSGIIVSGRKPARELYEGVKRLQEMYPDGIANYCLRAPL